MKTLFLTLLLAIPAAAIAQSTAPAQDAASKAVAQQDDTSRTERDARRDCMRHTGSRISASRADREARAGGDAEAEEKIGQLDRDDCVAANGRVYSREDLRRTGEVDIADALRKLDPAIR
ncbi:hypothetical protein [Lysobacter sp. F6437]|uniref:hypothetical protein n=1 Tax=Lysobacter sp. F6437 TaxID=3459296 RepID=UPI00403DC26E